MQNLWNIEYQRLLERLKKGICQDLLYKYQTPLEGYTPRQTFSRIEYEQCFCNQISNRNQERRRHNKRMVESVNLISPWKECAYEQFLSFPTLLYTTINTWWLADCKISHSSKYADKPWFFPIQHKITG